MTQNCPPYVLPGHIYSHWCIVTHFCITEHYRKYYYMLATRCSSSCTFTYISRPDFCHCFHLMHSDFLYRQYIFCIHSTYTLPFYLPVEWRSPDKRSSLLNSEISFCHYSEHSEIPNSSLTFISPNILC